MLEYKFKKLLARAKNIICPDFVTTHEVEKLNWKLLEVF